MEFRYRLQNRLQDSGWENMRESFQCSDEASRRASELSKDGWMGMVRVIDVEKREIVVTYKGGGGILT